MNIESYLSQTGSAESTETVKADHVIIAVGYRAENTMFNELEMNLDIDNIYNIGDSKQARTIMAAIWDAYEITRSL